MKAPPVSPVSFHVYVARLPQKGMPVEFEADARQREELAKAHDLLAVERFRVELLVEKWKRDGVKVTGVVEADIVQSCVVTLEPAPAHVSESVDALLVPEGSKLARREVGRHAEMFIDPEGPDIPETFMGDAIDVGALAEEFFTLGIDPYPRAPGVQERLTEESCPPDPAKDSPFSKLAVLRKKGS
jgi:uncharacterized metal-binding protein YceD (DUF177 family)